MALLATLHCTGGGSRPPPKPIRDIATGERLYAKGRQLAEQGQHVKAIAHFKAATIADSAHGLAYLDAAESQQYVGGDPQILHDLLARAVELLPSNPRALMLFGDVLGTLGQTDAAVDKWTAALALRPELVDARLQLAAVYQDRGKLYAAGRELETALQQAPKNVQVRVRLGQLYADDARFTDAALQVEIAADFAGGSAALYRRAARFYESGGRKDLARALRKKADRIDPPTKKRKYRKLRRARVRRKR